MPRAIKQVEPADLLKSVMESYNPDPIKMRKDIDLLLSMHAEEIRYASLRDNVSLKGTSLEGGVSNWLERFHQGLENEG